MNAVSWILGMLIAGGVVTTGISADRGRQPLHRSYSFLIIGGLGHAWAAGNRAYRPISG